MKLCEFVTEKTLTVYLLFIPPYPYLWPVNIQSPYPKGSPAMRKLFAFITLAALVFVAFPQRATAQALYPDLVVLQDTLGANARITADTLLGGSTGIDVQYAVQAIVSVKLQDLGGSGTYCPIILSSCDGVDWDSVRTDTLTAEEQNTVWTLSINDGVYTGGGGNTGKGANTVGVALCSRLAVYIDEIGADTGGSEIYAEVWLRQTKYKNQ